MEGDGLNFGRKLGEFKVKTSYFIASMAGGLLLAALGLLLFFQAVFSSSGLDLVSLFLAILILYLSGALFFFAYGRYQDMQTRYILYERGLQRQDGAAQKSIGWNQVRRVRREANKTGSRPREGKSGHQKHLRTLRLIGQGGKSLTIHNQPRLAGMVLGMLRVYHWPIVQEQIDQGNTVYLSRLQVSSEGLQYKGNLVPWSRIQRANTSGHIRLDTVSGRINWPEINDQDTNDVLGYALLQRAIEYYVGRDL